jgi:hypothetical protein
VITARGHLVEARVRLDNMIRGPWITLLILPLSLVASTLIQRVTATETAQRIMLIDPKGLGAKPVHSYE